MKLSRLTLCAAIMAIACGLGTAEDMDVRALQAKLAAQEARLNDLQAKMYGAGCDEGAVADGLTTLRKNATITIGGTVNTRYFYRSGTLKSSHHTLGGGGLGTEVRKSADARGGDLFIADAKLEGKIDVNEHFDAYFKFDLQSSDSHSDNAEQYWVRWKNIGNSGFGVLIGRDGLKYGMGPSVGVLDSWSAGTDPNGTGGMFSELFGSPALSQMNTHGTVIPMHTGWDYSRVTQVTPYWENCDGSFKAELSFFQDIDYDSNPWGERSSGGATTKYHKFRNDGVGSMSGRITWKPFEGLTLVASVINKHNKFAKDARNPAVYGRWNIDGNRNNLAASLGFEYIPAFLCDRLTLWGYYQHGWNEGWINNLDSDLVNAGVKFDFTDRFYGFVQGDYLYAKNDSGGGTVFHKAKGWAGYVGMGYVLPYGVNFEVGYKHEKIDFKSDSGLKHTKYKGDTVYAHLGFNF